MVTIDKRNRIRLAGVVALACAALVFAADVIMLGLPVSGSEVADYHILADIPEWRLRVGSYGAFVIIVFVVGVWQLYEGIKPAGAWWSIPPFLLLSYFFVSGALFHFLFPFIGAAVKAQAQMQGVGYETTGTLIQTMRSYWLVTYYISAVSLAIGTLWFSAAVLLRPTHFPRWMAALSPGIPIGAAFLLTRWLPAPVGGYLFPPAIHFATPLIFGASTALLWNAEVDSSEEAGSSASTQ
jgi:hypothetical protein